MAMIPRLLQPALEKLAAQYPVVTVTGPRQSGKTTLCRAAFPDHDYLNLESPDVREFARTDPRSFLGSRSKGVILDEIQRVPELVSYLQVMVDEHHEPGRFVLTGSQQFEVMSTITQSLAGRTTLLKLLPLSMEELRLAGRGESGSDKTLLTGFYPRIHDAGLDPTRTLGDYLETYVERDIRQLMAIKDLALFEKFVRLCAGRCGQLLNLQSLGNDTGVSHTTARSWLTLLEASYVVFLLQPWHVNISKRQVKTPKLYFYDVGLAAYLLGADMVVIEALKYRYNRGKRSNLYFWRDAKGNEVDLLLASGPDVFPVEIKAGATISRDYFKGLQAFASQLPSRPTASALVYDGRENQQRGQTAVWRATEVAAMMQSFAIETRQET